MQKSIFSVALYFGLAGGLAGFSQTSFGDDQAQKGAAASCPDTLTNPLYQTVKDNFLNIDFCNFAEYKISDHVADVSQDFPVVLGDNDLELRTIERRHYGASYLCDNNASESTLCRLITGGRQSSSAPDCGSSVNNDYQFALDNPSAHCRTDEWVDGYRSRIWFGAGNNSTYIAPLMGLPNHPVNRFCVEMELPADRLDSRFEDAERLESNPQLAQVANQEVLNDNLDWLRFDFGTYTSVYKSDERTDDEETGGTMQDGGTHFYHGPSNYGRYPMDQGYALGDNTLLLCMGENPTGVRIGMRPSYYLNPLMTVLGVDQNGHTDGYLYTPYVSRIYLDMRPTRSRHPWTVKFNRALMMYEFNDIFAMSGEGAVVGVDMIETGGTAVFPFTVYNWAPEARSYRVNMMNNSVLTLNSPSNRFKIFIDANADGQLDVTENEEIFPEQVLTLPADTDLHLVATYTSNFDEYQGVVNRFGRDFVPAGVTFREIGRLRSASYAFRTWQGTAADVANKNAILPTISNRGPDSEYVQYQEWNHRKPNNNRLIKNSPDFLRALQKKNDNIGMLFRDGFEG